MLPLAIVAGMPLVLNGYDKNFLNIFVTENDFINFNSDSRRIHSRRFEFTKQLHQSKERLKFNKKATAYLLECAFKTLSEAKSVHDTLESYYIEAMNFEKLNDFAEKFCKKIF